MDPKRIEEEFRKRAEIAKRHAEREALEFVLKKVEDMERVRDLQSLLLPCREMKAIITTRLRQIREEIRRLS